MVDPMDCAFRFGTIHKLHSLSWFKQFQPFSAPVKAGKVL
jgi:hypothetical protein